MLDTSEDQPDPELLETFIEEAREEIAAIGRHYPVWAENTGDDEALITVRRSFHTLKGSGRMVGAALIGEYCWCIEDLLNRVISGTVSVSRPLVGFLADAVAALPQLLEQLEAGAEPGADLNAIVNDAGLFVSGEVPERYAAVAEEEIEEPGLLEDETVEEIGLEPEDEGPAGLDPVLLDILTRETTGHIATIRKFLSKCRPGAEPFRITEEMHRACHTLHGSITMADAHLAAAVSGPLYHLIEQLYRQGIGLSGADHSNCEAAADATEAVIRHLGDPDSQPPDTAELQLALQQAVERLKQEAETADEQPDVNYRRAGPGRRPRRDGGDKRHTAGRNA